MATLTGTMVTDRAERYANQLVSHWAAQGPVTEQDGVITQRWERGQVVMLRPTEGALEVEVSVPDGEDLAPFAHEVKAHLERFGQRDELTLNWRPA